MARLLVRGGTIFDSLHPTGGAQQADIVVEDGRIVAVGPGLDGDEVIDAAGQPGTEVDLGRGMGLEVTDLDANGAHVAWIGSGYLAWVRLGADGTIYVSDDYAGVVYRVRYSGETTVLARR